MAAADREDERVWRRIQDWAREHDPDQLREAIEAFAGTSRQIPEEHIDLMCSWVHIDHRPGGGGSFAERYAYDSSTPAREREVAAGIAAARLGLWRVLAVAPGRSIELESVTDGSRARVHSGNVSREAVVWDLLLGRVMPGDPEASLWGPVAFYDPNEEPELLAELRRLADKLGVAADATGFAVTFRERARELLHFVPPSRSIEPEFFSVEGHPAAHALAVWELDDEHDALDALDSPPELLWMGSEPDRDCFVWALPLREALAGRSDLPRGAMVLESSPVPVGEEPPAELAGRAAVGTFEVERRDLSFIALSEVRLDAACALVERRLGDRARLVRREVTSLDVESVRERAKGMAPRPAEPPVPPRVRHELIEAQLERQYKRFLDEPQARLGGLSPREAASMRAHGEELEILLRGIENSAARARRRGDAFPDVTWLRAELGLDGDALAA